MVNYKKKQTSPLMSCVYKLILTFLKLITVNIEYYYANMVFFCNINIKITTYSTLDVRFVPETFTDSVSVEI